MSNPHYIRILVTHQPTHEYLERFLQRRLEGLQAGKVFAGSIGATAYRLNYEEIAFAFDGFASPPDPKLWKRHPRGGFSLRQKVSKALQAKRDELDAAQAKYLKERREATDEKILKALL